MSDEHEKRVRELEQQVDNLKQQQFHNKNEFIGCLALLGLIIAILLFANWR